MFVLYAKEFWWIRRKCKCLACESSLISSGCRYAPHRAGSWINPCATRCIRVQDELSLFLLVLGQHFKLAVWMKAPPCGQIVVDILCTLPIKSSFPYQNVVLTVLSFEIWSEWQYALGRSVWSIILHIIQVNVCFLKLCLLYLKFIYSGLPRTHSSTLKYSTL